MLIPDIKTRRHNTEAALETLRCLRCQSSSLSAEESCQQGVEPTQEKKFVSVNKKEKRVGDLKAALISGMEMQSLEFVSILLWGLQLSD